MLFIFLIVTYIVRHILLPLPNLHNIYLNLYYNFVKLLTVTVRAYFITTYFKTSCSLLNNMFDFIYQWHVVSKIDMILSLRIARNSGVKYSQRIKFQFV